MLAIPSIQNIMKCFLAIQRHTKKYRRHCPSAFSVGFQVEVGPVKVDVADTESLQTHSVCARPGGPCLLGGSGGMPPQKILTCYTLRDAFSCILKH